MPKHYEKYKNKQEITPDPKEFTKTYKGGIRGDPSPKKCYIYKEKYLKTVVSMTVATNHLWLLTFKLINIK